VRGLLSVAPVARVCEPDEHLNAPAVGPPAGEGEEALAVPETLGEPLGLGPARRAEGEPLRVVLKGKGAQVNHIQSSLIHKLHAVNVAQKAAKTSSAT
jgi:hypothetical protein